MPRTRHLAGFAAALWLVAMGGPVGCAQCRIPAIDPTGERLFSGTTTLASHDLLHCPLFDKHHTPATVAPVAAPLPVKPPCTSQVEAVPVAPVQPFVAVPAVPVAPAVPVIPVACGPAPVYPIPQTVLPPKPLTAGPLSDPGCPTPRGPELTITPSRIVAPINSEVVLAAGMCGPDGYYIMRQPIEWMLAQDGVGQIVEVGQESAHDISLKVRHSPHKVATNYARAHTSTISQVLDRGTKSCADDVYLHKGQSWITVSSPTEGASYVTVWAPQEHNWDRRKTTATIYWVDASWKFPAAITARAGGRQTLTTVVTRSGGQPVSGWLVKYDVLDGPPAVFSARGNTAVEVVTDAAGRATTEILPRSVEPGITAIRVQIIRPGTARGEQPQMVIGQGTTSVQWTTPGLTVRAVGTSVVMADGAVAYRVEVTNNGDLPTRGVSLSYSPPPGVSYLNSTPAAQNFGQRYEWRLGDMPPRTTSVVELNCRATVTASIRSCFRATSADQLVAEGCVPTDVRANTLSVKMQGPEAAQVGSEAKFLIDVTNTGPTPISNVTATDTFDPGLAHAGGERSPLNKTLAPVLGPGETYKLAISFNVLQPGRQCHRLDVTADGGHIASARGCVTGTQAAAPVAAQLSVTVIGPPSRRVGELAEYQIELRNNGNVPASNVALNASWPANMTFDRATQGHEDDLPRQTTRWRISQLPAGQSLTRQLVCRCVTPDERGAIVRAVVTSQQTAAVTGQMATIIAPASNTTPPPGGGPSPPEPSPQPQPQSGQLQVSLTALANPILVNATTTYVISVTNNRTESDRDVAVSLQVIGDGLTITRIPGSPTPVLRSGTDSVDFTPVREVRAGEQLAPYRIEIRGTKAGRHKLRVTVTSSRSPTGVVAEAETTVNLP